jgi:hypothetical protein
MGVGVVLATLEAVLGLNNNKALKDLNLSVLYCILKKEILYLEGKTPSR